MSRRHHDVPSYSTKYRWASQTTQSRVPNEPPRRWSEQETWRKVWQVAVLAMFVIYVLAMMIWR